VRPLLAIDAAEITLPTAWRRQSEVNRQGSADVLNRDEGARLSERERELQMLSRQVYEERLAKGVAREQARKDLPLSTYTEAYWKIDLHNLFHFLRLRMDARAQLEIRHYAEVIGDQIVARWCPLAWESFQEYQLGAVGFSRTEHRILRALLNRDATMAIDAARSAGWLEAKESGGLRGNRERREMEEKLRDLGHLIPWANDETS